MSTIVGIDPGKTGAITVMEGPFTENSYWGNQIEIFKMPEIEADIARFFDRFQDRLSLIIILEKLTPLPSGKFNPNVMRGARSSFKLAKSYGFLRGCALTANYKLDEVAPKVWQRALGCMSKGDKHVTLAKARELFPLVKGVNLKTADSLLIAEYGRRYVKPY